MTDREWLDVAAAVRRVLGSGAELAGEPSREPLEYDAFLAGRTLTRLRGTANVEGRPVEWSLVEKRTEGPSTASPYLYDNALREFEAYRSGLLDDLAPGLAAPRLLGAERDDAGGLTVWIEDLAPHGCVALSPERIVLAARHLGWLAGRWLGRVPTQSWLFDGWIERHMQPHAIAEGLSIITSASGNATVESRLAGRLAEAVALVRAQEDYRDAVERLTPTLCHHDAVAANVFSRERDGAEETVLIDWESVGPGPIGADLASLLFSSPRRGDFSARLVPELMPRAVAAYADGVREAGASVEREQIELGLHAAIALRWTLIRDVVGLLEAPGLARRGSAPLESSDEALAELVALVHVLLDSAAAARRLMAG